MLARAAILILDIAFLYIFKVKNWWLLAAFLTVGTAFFFFREAQRKASSFNFLTLIFIMAVVVLGSLKGMGTPGLWQLSLAVLFTPLLVFERKKAVFSIPFWLFTGWAIGEIFARKYGNWGYMLSLTAVFLYIKDILEKRKEEKENG